RKLKADRTKLPVLGNGLQKKSYLHVGDCVTAMFVAVEKAREPINVFNLGHTDWIEVKDSIDIITKTMGLTPRIDYAGREPVHGEARVGSVRRVDPHVFSSGRTVEAPPGEGCHQTLGGFLRGLSVNGD